MVLLPKMNLVFTSKYTPHIGCSFSTSSHCALIPFYLGVRAFVLLDLEHPWKYSLSESRSGSYRISQCLPRYIMIQSTELFHWISNLSGLPVVVIGALREASKRREGWGEITFLWIIIYNHIYAWSRITGNKTEPNFMKS